jgi:hypothetical protein
LRSISISFSCDPELAGIAKESGTRLLPLVSFN